MEGNRKHVLDKFLEHLTERYEAWCERHEVDKTDIYLVTFLIDQDLIPSAQIRRYTIVGEFEKLYNKSISPKTQTVNMLAHRFNISERTVWKILKQAGGTVGQER